jgi:hypothetical protein
MHKRRRLDVPENSSPLPSLDATATPSLQALTCVKVVCRHGPEVLRLPHVVAGLHAFLDCSAVWTLSRACSKNFLHLAHRLMDKDTAEPLDSTKRFPGFRQWQFSTGIISAITEGNFRLVQLLSTYFTGCYVPQKAALEAATCGRTEILQWLVTHRSDARCDTDVVGAVIQGDHIELAKWLVGKMSPPSEDSLDLWTTFAAENGNLDMLRWICSLSEGLIPLRAVHFAVNHGHLEVVKWAMQRKGATVLRYYIFIDEAVKKGCLDVLEWLLSNHHSDCRIMRAGDEAAQNGRLDILQLLHMHNVTDFAVTAMDSAAEGGQLDVIKWLHSCQIKPFYALNCAARNGHLEVVKWLHENTASTCTTFAMDAAAEHNHLEVLQWLHENRSEGCTVSAMDMAAANGHLGILQWLQANRNEGCTIDAMNLAAEAGHLHVLEWLHENRREGCTSAAMDNAARNGHLGVVEWLHNNRSEGCTTDAMDQAAKSGHLALVEWLDANRSEGCTTEAMNEAARNNHLHVVKWLHANRSEGCSTDAMDGAAAQGHMEIIRWLQRNRSEGCTRNALEVAVRKGYFEMALFLHQNYQSCYYLAENLRDYKMKLWGFAEWMYTHHRDLFESTMVRSLFVQESSYFE